MPELELLSFVPFRLNRLAVQGPCSAQLIVRCTLAHKSRISRGVSRLLDLDLVERSEGQQDRREASLRLTSKGRALHRNMVPVVLAQAKRIMSCLSNPELLAFTHAMDKLEHSLQLVQRPRKNCQ